MKEVNRKIGSAEFLREEGRSHQREIEELAGQFEKLNEEMRTGFVKINDATKSVSIKSVK